MIRRDRPKQVYVQNTLVLDVSVSAVLQVGDVFGPVDPFSYGEAYGAYRGAPSFVTEAELEPVNTRLHYANQVDEDYRDSNIVGEQLEVFSPNVRGVKAR